MAMIFIIIIIVVSTLLFVWYRNESHLPCGPRGVPILGYFPFLGSNQVATIQKLSKEYGSIMKLNLLNENFYFLNSFEVINEAFVNQGENFAGRPITEFNLISFIHGKKGILANEGDVWRIQQKFMINKLSGLGMGKTDFSYKIHEICDDLVNYIKEESELNNLWMYLSNFTSNVISTLLYSKTYEPTDPVYKELVESVEKFMGTGTDLYFYLTGPVAAFLMKSNRKLWTNFVNAMNDVFDFMYKRIQERVEDEDSQRDCNDILDYCIKEMRGPNSDLFDKKTIVRNYLLMFIAGTDTTSSTLNFGFYFMASNPEIQQKVYNEIMDVFGNEHRVLFTEIDRVNYTRAVIAEIQRMACVVPLGLMHVNREETTVCGYRFPRRSKFIANIYSVSRDKRYFKNPNVFDPNNFLDENGNYTPIDANMPFGIGKRKCMGYKLAEMELFIAFTRLIQEFEWLPPKDEEMKFKVNDALIRYLSPYKIIAKTRH